METEIWTFSLASCDRISRNQIAMVFEKYPDTIVKSLGCIVPQNDTEYPSFKCFLSTTHPRLFTESIKELILLLVKRTIYFTVKNNSRFNIKFHAHLIYSQLLFGLEDQELSLAPTLKSKDNLSSSQFKLTYINMRSQLTKICFILTTEKYFQCSWLVKK
jgi:hypothetical protein